MRRHILILGGTTQARQLASILAERKDLRVTLSLAGRTATPLTQPVPVRRGGFGGVEGLAQYLSANQIHLLIDATHPFARVISVSAIHAAQRTNTALLSLRRPPWQPLAGDRWIDVEDADDAVLALGVQSRNVFLALGRQEVEPFTRAPQHRYLIRSVDPLDPPLALPDAHYILARGPFEEADERELLAANSIGIIVAKNSGGAATYGKIAAARSLGIPVVMYRRPPEPQGPCVASIEAAVEWLNHALAPPIDRGV